MNSNYLKAQVRVDRILFPKNGREPGSWVVATCEVEEVLEGELDCDYIKVTGSPYEITVGGVYLLEAELSNHARYGESYRIKVFSRKSDMNDPNDKRNFLESLYTERQLANLYAVLDDPYTVLLNSDAQKLLKVEGVGPATARRMIATFHDNFTKMRAYVALAEYELPASLIASLIKRFRGDIDRMVDTIQTNPYVMMYEIDGIGWKRADEIAKMRGIAFDSPLRIEANIRYQLNQAADEGHTWLAPSALVQAVCNDLGLDTAYFDAIRAALNRLHDQQILWWDEEKSKVALCYLHDMEAEIAQELHRIACGDLPSVRQDAEQALREQELSQGWEFTKEQHEAIQSIENSNVCIITGSAGTGKSSVVAGFLRLMPNTPFAQCALSGRAAARLTEVTGQEGMTIHRLLGYQDGHFLHGADCPLVEKVIILDEISMVGAEIFLALLRAIPSGSKLIMLGDDGQLESIGMCNVFKDMLDSGVLAVSRLTQIHRQAAKSAIVTESLRVRNQEPLFDYGWLGEETRGELQDLKIRVYQNPILSQDCVMEEYRKLYDQGVDYQDIQIVVPMKQRGMLATRALNNRVQALVNPPLFGRHEVVVSLNAKDPSAKYTLRERDRVICTKNMYQAEHPMVADQESPEICPVFNGDRGIIKEITPASLIVTFDMWGDIVIKRADFSKIELGYALSCHKLQGSEAPYVIVGLDMPAKVLLTKEWLYTAITRAKKYCVVCGEDKAIRYAIATSHVPYKQTMLRGMLQEEFTKDEP